MNKATVTYSAPKGDSKVVEMLGYTFFDGVGQEIECDDDRLKKLQGNPLFKVTDGGKVDPATKAQDKPAPDHKHK
jgi:hypothetical protein